MKFFNNSGYTLVELLAVVSIMVTISTIIAGIMYSTLRGSSKTNITTAVVQNGNYAMSVISNIIIDSSSVTQIDGVDITDCTASPSGKTITLKRLSGGTTTLACLNAVSPDIPTVASNGSSLINTNQVQVNYSSCYFFCSQKNADPYSPPLVGVGFKITDQGSDLFERQASGNFESSISLRTYSP